MDFDLKRFLKWLFVYMPAIIFWGVILFIILSVLFLLIKTGYEQYRSENYHKQLYSLSLPYEKTKIATIDDIKINIIDYKENSTLTIDKTFQSLLENKLFEKIKESNAIRGLAISIDPLSGEIIALTNYPAKNSFEMLAEKPIPQNNIFKPITYTIGLVSNKINANTQFIDEGKLKEGKFVISNANQNIKYPQKNVSLKESFQYSSNVIPLKIAKLVGKDEYYQELKKLMLTDNTGIDVKNEKTSSIKNDDAFFVATAYGYGFELTPIQIIKFYSSVLNNGNTITPHIKSDIKVETKNIMSTKIANDIKELVDLRNGITTTVINNGSFYDIQIVTKEYNKGKVYLEYLLIERPLKNRKK